MVDAPDSKSGEGNLVRVRVSPALPTINKAMKNIKTILDNNKFFTVQLMNTILSRISVNIE